MEYEKPIFSGYLNLPPNGKSVIKKSSQQKYCLLFKASNFGIDRLEIYDNVESVKNASRRIITFEDCIKISPSPTNQANFIVTTKSAVHEFSAVGSQSVTEWLSALQSVVFPDDISNLSSVEDNDLYCSSGEGIFNVKLLSSPASLRCGLEAKSYMLVLATHAVQLRSCCDSKLLFTWPYCFIRRYGYKNGRFTFEAGRRCDSGEGIFYIEHSDQQEIFRCFASKIKSMKQILSDESVLLSSTLNMEARSRSPLAVSSASFSLLTNVDTNISTKSQISIPDIEESEQMNKTKPPTVMPKPAKPPRRNIPQKDESVKMVSNMSSAKSYETVDKYDEVEFRSEAWKTLGVDDVKHTECINDEEEYTSWGTKKKTSNALFKSQIVAAPKVIMEIVSPSQREGYDKLNHFGSTSKMNVPSTYKQVNVSVGDSYTYTPSFNEYDEVQEVIETARTADDSHLGYALIRKETVKTKDKNVNHQFHNNEPYAMISKSKQV